MTHRRYLPNPKPELLERPPLRNNEARLKHIYEAQLFFKNKDPFIRKSLPKSTHPKPSQQLPQPKLKSQIQQLNLAEIKHSQRYRDHEKQTPRDLHIYQSNQHKARQRFAKEPPALTSRNREELNYRQQEEPSTDRSEHYKIRRKSISGSLRKKQKEQQIQHLSANPVLPSELNYYDEARRHYKEGRISEALRLFELTLEKQPDKADAYYYCALCLLSKHSYQKAFEFLNNILAKFPQYEKKTVYLFAGIAAKHTGQADKAIALVSEGLQKYPDYNDLYLYRAKVYDEMRDYEKALHDYELILRTKKDNSEVLLNCALCYKALGKLTNCLSMLNSAFYSGNSGLFKGRILLERIKIYYEQKKIKQCKKDIKKLQEIQPQNCEMYYYKGLIQLSEDNKKDALLSFQRCIRINSSKECVAKSLVEISKSKIEDRDFYSALYHINRAQFLEVASDDIHKFKLFTEGVVFLMKRKINEGVKNLDELQERFTLGPYFDKLFYLYRAFGHFMQNKHQLAIEDYKMAEQFIPKDKHITYNQLIAEGIVKATSAEFQAALEKFDQAQRVISLGTTKEKIQPYIYRAMTFAEKIKANLKETNKADELQTLQEVFIALKELDKAYDVNDSNSNMLYLRSLIYMFLGKVQDGLQDIIKAISKSEENVAKYFFFRALAHETQGNSKQALNDFNICINLDQKHSRAYFQRAKLYFSNQQATKGLQDLKKYSELEPSVNIKIHQCCLFYLAKEYDVAESCLMHIPESEEKTNLKLMIDFKQLRISQAKNKMSSMGDMLICDIILGEWQSEVQETFIEDLSFFNRMQYYCYLGIKYFNLSQFQEAINQFTMAIKEKTLMDLEENTQNNSEEQNPDSEEQPQIPINSETKQNQLHYLNYNLFVSYLANNQNKKAYQVFVRDLLPAKQSFLRSQAVGQLSKLLFQTLKIQKDSPNEAKVFQFYMFRSILGESSDYIDIELPHFILRTKLCYPMPYAKKIYKQYSAKIDPSFILQCLKISEVENRPEPPWVKRKDQDLIFTDEVRDINVEFQTTEHDEENQEEEEEYEEEEGSQGNGEGETVREEQSERQQTPFDPRRFKEQMKLDDDIERKLNKIMQAKKKTQ